jgi:hypothetical protein
MISIRRISTYTALYMVATFLRSPHTLGIDLTLEPSSVGEEVVVATVRKLYRSGLFQDDYTLSFRAAYVSTRFGKDNKTYEEESPFRGIWQITQEQLLLTQTSEPLAELRSRIPKAFPEIGDWSLATWADMVKPLYNGLAFRLYLETFVEQIYFAPWCLLIDQGRFYSSYLNSTTTPEEFVQQVENLEASPRCGAEMDIIFVHDGSCTNFPENFTNTRVWMSNLVDTFTFSNVRVGYIAYSSQVLPVVDLQNQFTPEELRDNIVNGPRPRKYL